MKKYFTEWKYVSRLIILAQFLFIILGIFYTHSQFQDLKNSRLNRQNDLSMRYYDLLNSSTNRQIYIAIEHNKPLFNTNGGKFNSDQTDDYLGYLHDVGQALNRGLLDNDNVCSSFSDMTEKTWDNKEIQTYLSAIRKQDPTYFLGFDDLHSFIESCE